MSSSEDFCVARYRHGEVFGTTLAGWNRTGGFCQYTKRFDPNPGVFISGYDHVYKASTLMCVVMEVGMAGAGK